MIIKHFEKKQNKMRETRNDCFGPKKRNMTLNQAKTGKHECRNITAAYKTKYNGKI